MSIACRSPGLQPFSVARSPAPLGDCTLAEIGVTEQRGHGPRSRFDVRVSRESDSGRSRPVISDEFRPAVVHAPLVVVTLVGGLSFARVTQAAETVRPAVPRPVILSMRVSALHGLPLPANGARVTITARTRNATRCTFMGQHIAFASLHPLNTVNCASGYASSRQANSSSLPGMRCP